MRATHANTVLAGGFSGHLVGYFITDTDVGVAIASSVTFIMTHGTMGCSINIPTCVEQLTYCHDDDHSERKTCG
jgi:hypothetical protein